MSLTFFHRWFPQEPNNQEAYLEEVARVLPLRGKVLDVGCGDHRALAHFRTPEREIWGCDFQFHPEQAHAEWVRRMPADGSLPFPAATFDVVTALMVLEHVRAPERFLAEVARVLRPGGVFVGQSVSALHYVTWLRRLFGLLPHAWNQRLVKRLYGRECHDTFPAYYRLNTGRALDRAGRPHGLDAVRLHYHANPGYFLFSPLLCRGAVLADWLLDRVHPALGRIYFTVTLHKPTDCRPSAWAA